MNDITPFIALVISSTLTFFGARVFLRRNIEEALIMMLPTIMTFILIIVLIK